MGGGVNSLSRGVFFSHFVAALSPVACDHFLGDNWANYQGKWGWKDLLPLCTPSHHPPLALLACLQLSHFSLVPCSPLSHESCEALGIFWGGFDYCPLSIIPVTLTLEYFPGHGMLHNFAITTFVQFKLIFKKSHQWQCWIQLQSNLAVSEDFFDASRMPFHWRRWCQVSYLDQSWCRDWPSHATVGRKSELQATIFDNNVILRKMDIAMSSFEQDKSLESTGNYKYVPPPTFLPKTMLKSGWTISDLDWTTLTRVTWSEGRRETHHQIIRMSILW